MNRYWDEQGEGRWIDTEPERSAEDEYLALFDVEDDDLMPEIFLAMGQLTVKQRFVIECRYGMRSHGRQMNVREIAALLGISHQAVMRLIQRGLRRLERELWALRTSTTKNHQSITSEPQTDGCQN